MAWVCVMFDVAAREAQALSDALLEFGAYSIEIGDALAGQIGEQPIFDEPGEEGERNWEWCRLTALFGADVDPFIAVREACTLTGVSVPHNVTTRHIAEQDWVQAARSQFVPIEVSSGLWVVPSWHDVVDSSAINLRLDPGLAFGTGSHPTTLQCLRWLHQQVRPGDAVLDYGCGSGILAIAASKLGADPVVGVDIDENAIRASRDNAALNQSRAQFCEPPAMGDSRYDIVVANILANPLRVLAPLLARYVRPNGRIALAGILQQQSEFVQQAYATWFDLFCVSEMEGWVCLAGIRR
jgi:ribosomal protein L11 methyltransferase